MTASAIMRAKPRMWISFVAQWLEVFCQRWWPYGQVPVLAPFPKPVAEYQFWQSLVAEPQPTERRMPKPARVKAAHQNIDLKHQ